MFVVCLYTMLQLEIADMLSSSLANFTWAPLFPNVPSANIVMLLCQTWDKLT